MMDKNIFKIEVTYCQTSDTDKLPMINITDSTETFDYSSVMNMYEGGRMGHGIQVSKEFVNKENVLMKMCDKIAQAVYEAKKELNK